MVEEALEDVDALQGEEPSTTGATDEAHPNQELGDILSEMVTLLSSVNYKGRIPNAGDLVERMKRTRDSLKEDLVDVPVKAFKSARQRQHRF
jgi:NTP pyrophosphatase (non-canonical NTP hydrolase)